MRRGRARCWCYAIGRESHTSLDRHTSQGWRHYSHLTSAFLTARKTRSETGVGNGWGRRQEQGSRAGLDRRTHTLALTLTQEGWMERIELHERNKLKNKYIENINRLTENGRERKGQRFRRNIKQATHNCKTINAYKRWQNKRCTFLKLGQGDAWPCQLPMTRKWKNRQLQKRVWYGANYSHVSWSMTGRRMTYNRWHVCTSF